MAKVRGLWYTRFRSAALVNAAGSLVWTALIVIPFQPFSYLPPIMVHGGPGTWFVLAYILYLTVGVGVLAALSALLFQIEVHEKRVIASSTMWFGFILLNAGILVSCILLGVGGVAGGYALSIANAPEKAVESILSPFVYPITTTVLVAVAGTALTLFALVRARARKL